MLQSYFQLIGPLVFLGFGLGFYLVYNYARELVSARTLALCYAFGTVGFLFEIFPSAYSQPIFLPFYMLCATFAAWALYQLYNRPVPTLFLVVSFSLLCVIDWYFLFVVQSPVLRVVNGNLGAAIIFGYPAIALWKYAKLPIDKITLALLFVSAVQYVIRPAITLSLEARPLTIENYHASVTATTQQLVTTIGAVVLGIALFIRFGMAMVENLSERAETDVLTGLANRRGLEKFVSKVKSNSNTVQIFDLDHFKSVNDQYGHDAGDDVLCKVANVLKQMDDEFVFCARLGGEEFVVVVEDISPHTAKLFGQSLCAAIAAVDHDLPGRNQVTTSVGIATWNEQADFSRALRKADKALYRAKKNGRNQVCFEDESYDSKDTIEPDLATAPELYSEYKATA